MTDNSLAAPVARLLELGEPKYTRDFAWPDYQSYGIGMEHIPILIQIATDQALINLEDELDPRGWGPVHAWRALGQLHSTDAIIPLMKLFHEVRDNDWVIEEMPDVFALIGPAAFPQLAAYLRDEHYPVYSRMVAATSLMQMGLVHPFMREQCVEVLGEQLAAFQQNSPGTNGVLIANLVELQAVEKVDLIQKVFSEGKVDRFIGGDWRDVKVRLSRPANQAGTQAAQKQLAKDVDRIPPDPASRPVYKEPRTQPKNGTNSQQ